MDRHTCEVAHQDHHSSTPVFSRSVLLPFAPLKSVSRLPLSLNNGDHPTVFRNNSNRDDPILTRDASSSSRFAIPRPGPYMILQPSRFADLVRLPRSKRPS